MMNKIIHFHYLINIKQYSLNFGFNLRASDVNVILRWIITMEFIDYACDQTDPETVSLLFGAGEFMQRYLLFLFCYIQIIIQKETDPIPVIFTNK